MEKFADGRPRLQGALQMLTLGVLAAGGAFAPASEGPSGGGNGIDIFPRHSILADVNGITECRKARMRCTPSSTGMAMTE
jgi:hypothetical protein